MNITTKIILSVIVFLLSIYVSVIFEGDYRKLIRWLYESISEHKISFHHPRKYFHLASGIFVLSIALFNVILLNFIFSTPRKQLVLSSASSVLGSIVSIIIYSYIDSLIKVLECTACDNGLRQLNYDDIKYDRIMLIALIVAIIPWSIGILKKRKTKNRNIDNGHQDSILDQTA